MAASYIKTRHHSGDCRNLSYRWRAERINSSDALRSDPHLDFQIPQGAQRPGIHDRASEIDTDGLHAVVNTPVLLRMVRAFVPVLAKNGGGAVANMLSVVSGLVLSGP